MEKEAGGIERGRMNCGGDGRSRGWEVGVLMEGDVLEMVEMVIGDMLMVEEEELKEEE